MNKKSDNRLDDKNCSDKKYCDKMPNSMKTCDDNGHCNKMPDNMKPCDDNVHCDKKLDDKMPDSMKPCDDNVHSNKKPDDKMPDNKKHYEGVYPAVRKNGEAYYRASLTYKRKHISLGSFSEPETAHAAYREATCLLTAQPDSAPSLADYSPSSPLPFEKWVCLLNFRDNGIYLGNPIYIRSRFFYYYMSPEHILKFDLDDLFYYSSHKIMCRGNHYFVADYGMQVNISSRYGIKNYAVPGVDFRFINGDTTDFRRENIEILNCYHGVRIEEGEGRCLYHVRIHIHGNYRVGTYATAVEAAIAYNKAIDILKKKGVSKNFTPNYVEGISPSQYAEIYSRLTVSDNIMNYPLS